MENSNGVFGYMNGILFAHVVAYDLVFYDLAKAQQIYERLLIPQAEEVCVIEAANHNISVIVGLLSRRCEYHPAEHLFVW